VVVLVSAAD